MFGLEPMSRSVNRLEKMQTVFGGLDHNMGAGDGTIWDLYNMSSDRYPLLTTRPRRYQYALVSKPNGMHVRDCICWVDGTDLYVDGVAVGTVTDGQKTICGIQDKLCIWPDKVLCDRTTGELKDMEAEWSGEVGFADGTYAGETALANTITAAGDLSQWFRAGDAVTVQLNEGVLYSEPMGAYVIRELEYDTDADRTELRFYEETWRRFVTETGSSEETEDGAVSFPGVGTRHDVIIRRSVPDLDVVFEHHNRLWGCKGSAIYASKLGDPTNWEVFDGLATDSYELQSGSPGAFTAGCSYGGRPVFFKERSILKIYGDTPANFQTSETQSLGVEAGSGGSLAVAGDTLFYKSPAGIMAYTGGYPRSVAGAFGGVKYRNAVAGSDGVKYYVSMEDCAGEWRFFVYDTRCGIWHPEGGKRMVAFGCSGELYAMEERGVIWVLGDVRSRPEGAAGDEGLASMVEFNDWTDGTLRKKGTGKLLLRLEVQAGTTLTVKMQYDSDGVWRTIRKVEGAKRKQQFEIPVSLRRCDHYRLRIEGNGLGDSGWTLHALTWDRYTGSNRK